METLKLGKMMSKELAAWFGILPKTYCNNRQKYLKLLQEYARFEVVHGGVIIKDIYIAEYVKPAAITNYQKVKEQIDSKWDESGLDTKKNVAHKIEKECDIPLASSTTYNYVCKASNELYGRPEEPWAVGEIGVCCYRLCVYDVTLEKLRWFTEEEFKMKKQLAAEYFTKHDDEELREVYALQYGRGEITREQYGDRLAELD